MTDNLKKEKTILVVDDDTTLRDAIVFDFKRRGYEVFSAANGTEAFQIVKTKKIDVVITDVRMPQGTGIELLDNIKSYSLRNPAVIFITGFSDLALDETYDKGTCVVMNKPFDRKSLIASVERALLPYSEKFVTPMDVLETDLKVELKFEDNIAGNRANVLNIGQGGMFLASTTQTGKPNQRVSFRFENPGHGIALLSGQGIIRWMRHTDSGDLKRGMGIEIIFLEENCRTSVIALLESLQIKAYIPRNL
ncbi:MAG: response regulator [Bdellovibrionia bacterium]